MSRATAIVVAALCGLACMAQPAVSRTSHCHARHGYQAIATNGRVVYFANTGVYGTDVVCHVRTGRRTVLDNRSESYRYARLRIVGDYVAYEWEGGEGPDGYAGVDLVSARTGQETLLDIKENQSVGYFKKLVLQPDGATAWSTRHAVYACRRACVRRIGEPVAVHEVTLADGQRVDGKSLTPIARGIAWREAGRWHRARLG